MSDSKFRLESKFLTDTAWNYGAFAVMAGTGVILNFFIAIHFGIETLGVFNQIYAVYVISAQLAVMGFHDSAQKHTSAFDESPDDIPIVSAAALLLAGGVGLVTASALYGLSTPIGLLAESEAVGKGLALVAPGLFFFAINKVLMGVLNGTRRMKAFAFGQGFRILVILISCLAVAWLEQPGYMLGISFTIAELVLLPALLFLVRPHPTHFASDKALWNWVRVHFHFGTKALINGFLAESYIRIDIVMLGIFASDHAVGIYSFAAMFAEGLFQVPTVVRNITNPVLARLLSAGDKKVVAKFCRKVAGLSLLIFVAAAGLVLLVFPFLQPFFPEGLVVQSHSVLMILISGLVIYSAMIPLDHVLLQAGLPGRQSVLMTINVLVNTLLNLALIPLYGIHGAAIATAIAFVVASILINLTAWKWLGYRGGLLLSGIRNAPDQHSR